MNSTLPKRETTPADDALADVIAYLLRRMAEDDAGRKSATATPASDEAARDERDEQPPEA